MEESWSSAWLMTLAAWLGILTELFYVGHGIALCTILGMLTSEAVCSDILVRLASFILVHHLIALIICGVGRSRQWRQKPHEHDQPLDDLHKCVIVTKVVVFVGCMIGVSSASACILTPLGICILAYLGAVLSSLVLLFLMAVMLRVCNCRSS